MFVFSPMVKLTRARVPLLAFPTPESVISKATWCSQTCPHIDEGRSQTEMGAADFQFPYMEVDHFGTHRSVLMVTHLVCPRLPNFPRRSRRSWSPMRSSKGSTRKRCPPGDPRHDFQEKTLQEVVGAQEIPDDVQRVPR